MIRMVEPSDLAALTEFFASNDVPEVTRHFSPFPLNAKSAEQICNQGEPDRFFIDEDGGVIKALGMLRGWKDGYAIPSFGLLVDRRFAGQGIGGRVTAFAIDLAKTLRAPAVRLSVEPDNAAAIKVYARAGFQLTDKRAGERLVMTVQFQ
jgi:ribosomal protein S18 acetylase RimI-like enzyme